MVNTGAGNGLPKSVSVAFEMFSRARKAIARCVIPSTDILPDGASTVNAVSVLTTATSPPQQVTFICDGYLVGLTASVRSGSGADEAGTLLAVVINGSTSLFQAAQQGTGYVPFGQLRPNGVGGFFRIMAPIRQSVPYQVYVQNTTAGTIVADVTLYYVNTSSPPLTD